MSKVSKVHQLFITVGKDDIDNLHTNNLSYIKWVLKAAESHWNSIATDKMQSDFLWVVLRHEIDYVQPTFINEQLTIQTWIKSNIGVKSERIIEIYKKDKTLVAKAKTTWCLLEKKSMKPKRIPNEIIEAFK